MLLTGYLNRLSYRPGDSVDVRVSADADQVILDLVRLRHGDVNPAGPGFRTDDVPVTAQRIPGRLQPIYPGSYMRATKVIAGAREIEFDVTVWPTTPEVGRVQGVLSLTDQSGRSVVALALDETGTPALTTPDGVVVRACQPLLERRWYRLTATVAADRCQLAVTALNPLPVDHDGTPKSAAGVSVERASGVLAAALDVVTRAGHLVPAGLYNGKIEAPEIRVDGTVAALWAFEDMTDLAVAVDITGNGHHGELRNGPARAMTGSNWTGDVDDFRQAPEQYGAIHFHDDDLIDAEWEIGATVTLPADLPSGVYAIRLRTVDTVPAELPSPEVDHIPFAVLPAVGAARKSVAFVLPTFTYIAYANERLMHRLDYEAAGITDHPIVPGFHDRLLAEHPEFGSSLYDHHSDGSGVCYSSFLRPIPNLRPDYRMWLQNAPRHLGADLYTVAFFDHAGIEYDLLTDHDVNADGAAAFDGYQVVVTGSHPEYYSGTMLDAVQAHVEVGGCLMYLGGNGFYWVTAADPHRPEVLEVRRSAGIRTWEAGPGEHHLSTTGERGGLWRWRGRSPNKLLGVGMCSQGWDEKAPPFIRSDLSYQPEYAWVFEGIDDHEIGDFGLIMNGACGDELDRYDPALGSPPNTAVLATSGRHSNYYQLAVEDVLMLAPGLGGKDCDDVRSDMVLVEHAGGGAVFSVGSICFTGCLPWNGFDNNAAQLVHNVLTNFRNRDSKKS